MAEATKTPSEAPQESTLFGRVKHAVGLSPKEHKLDIQEHETEASPGEGISHEPTAKEVLLKETYTTPQQQLAEQEAPAARKGAFEAPPSSSPTPAPSLEPAPENKNISPPPTTTTTTPQTPTILPTTTTQGQRGRRREDLTAKVIEEMESRGFKHVTGDEAAAARQFYEQQQQQKSSITTATTTTAAREEEGKLRGVIENPLFEPKEEGVLEPTQGERVKVSRYYVTGAPTTTTATTEAPLTSEAFVSTTTAAAAPIAPPEFLKKEGGIQEVYARPKGEGKAMTGGEVAGFKAKEHAIIAEEAEKRAAEKHTELLQLRRQAEELEKQSAILMAEAETERKRIEFAQEKLEEIEQSEWRGYAQAERAEQQRRAVVARAKPAVRTAESREREAMYQKQLASDAQFHAQVLENRARALIKESQEMAELSLNLSTEAARVNSQLMISRQEAEELKASIDTQAARGLPSYINECEKEIGALSHRITQLREEIAWAEGEMERGREEADTLRRVVVAKEGQAARLLLQLTQLHESAEEARRRSKSAAEEARIPTELAEQKYEEAWAAARAAEAAEEEAMAAQHEALEVVKAAVHPEQERQRALAEAAAAEAAAVQLETKAGVVAGKVQRQEYEAKVKEKTAAAKQEEAVQTEAEMKKEQEIQGAEEKMVETYREQQKEHRPIAVPAI